ncbi:hypothetical protein MHM97_15745 [Epibacterium sp. Ofav1-8]|nr:hypothetical protein [Epibacterium sp. Ofav1-8]
MTPKEFTQMVSQHVIGNKNFNKIFGIGFNKTGTTTLRTILQLYGYNVAQQQTQEARLTKAVFHTDYTEFKSFCDKHDAFQDMPFSQGLTYVAADALFPNSKFILTERDVDAWFTSMTRFHQKSFKLGDMDKVTEQDIREKIAYLYPDYIHFHKERLLTTYEGATKQVLWDKLYDYDYYTKAYQYRNEAIKTYFADAPDKLLVIDVTKEVDTSRICQFLNIPAQYTIKMPHENKT